MTEQQHTEMKKSIWCRTTNQVLRRDLNDKCRIADVTFLSDKKGTILFDDNTVNATTAALPEAQRFGRQPMWVIGGMGYWQECMLNICILLLSLFTLVVLSACANASENLSMQSAPVETICHHNEGDTLPRCDPISKEEYDQLPKYNNPPIPNSDSMPLISGFFRYYPSQPTIRSDVRKLYVGNNNVSLLILEKLHSLAAGDFSRPSLLNTFKTSKANGGCSAIKFDPTLFRCAYIQQTWNYLRGNGTPEKNRYIHARGICESWFLFKYPNEKLDSDPVSVDGEAGCTGVAAKQLQFEAGVPAGGVK